MRRSEPFLKMSLLILLFPGLAEACNPHEGNTFSHAVSPLCLMSRLSPGGNISHAAPSDLHCMPLSSLLGLLSLQVLRHRHNSSPRFSSVKPLSATTPSRKPPPKRRNRWNFLKCAYVVITHLFMTYNKADWCYCHYCNLELDIRDDPCCSF
uniref:Epididymal protein 13 n=1 Tax=Aotus nancymaae TaxID=37293 RepID=A0A2K5DWJ1_AOTNA